MDATRMPKSVRRIVLLQPDGSGGHVPVTLYEKAGDERKKQSPLFRPIERVVRRTAAATAAFAQTYADAHNNSNRKNKDGWLRDINSNMTRATERGVKRLKITRLLMP